MYKQTSATSYLKYEGNIVKYFSNDPNNLDYQEMLLWISEGNPVEYLSQEVLDIVPISPMEVTMRQARLALHDLGKLQEVTELVNSSNNPVIQIEWEYASTVRKDNPIVLSMIGNQFTAEEVDQFFLLASTK